MIMAEECLPMTNDISIGQLIALIVPIVVVDLALMAFALRDLVRRKRVKGGNKWVWAAVIVFISAIGPIAYLIAGREEESR